MGGQGIRGSLRAVAGMQSRFAATLTATSDEIAHSDCLDEEDRSEIYAILKAITGDAEMHRRTVETLSDRIAKGGADA